MKEKGKEERFAFPLHFYISTRMLPVRLASLHENAYATKRLCRQARNRRNIYLWIRMCFVSKSKKKMGYMN